MAHWMTIAKKGPEVFFKDGKIFNVGQRVGLGMGGVELHLTPKTGLHVVRFSGSGNVNYVLKLTRDGEYRLGPSYGHRVKKASEETDPILRVLRVLGIPVTNFRRTSEPTLKISRRWYDNAHCPNGRPTYGWETDGQVEWGHPEEMEKPQGYFSGGGSQEGILSGATYAIRIGHSRSMGGCDYNQVEEVIVWPSCEALVLYEALAGEARINDSGVNIILEQLPNLEAARRWVETQYRPDPGYKFVDKPDVLCFSSGFTAQLPNGEVEYNRPYVYRRLIEAYGLDLLRPFLGKRQLEFVDATASLEAAVAYITARFAVVKAEKDGQPAIRFGDPEAKRAAGGKWTVKGTVVWKVTHHSLLSDPNDPVIPILRLGDRIYPLALEKNRLTAVRKLLEKYGQELISLLYEKAEEPQ